jgi:hypothetical protein
VLPFKSYTLNLLHPDLEAAIPVFFFTHPQKSLVQGAVYSFEDFDHVFSGLFMSDQ